MSLQRREDMFTSDQETCIDTNTAAMQPPHPQEGWDGCASGICAGPLLWGYNPVYDDRSDLTVILHCVVSPELRDMPLANGARMRQSRPDSGLGFQVRVLKPFDRLW